MKYVQFCSNTFINSGVFIVNFENISRLLLVILDFGQVNVCWVEALERIRKKFNPDFYHILPIGKIPLTKNDKNSRPTRVFLSLVDISGFFNAIKVLPF